MAKTLKTSVLASGFWRLKAPRWHLGALWVREPALLRETACQALSTSSKGRWQKPMELYCRQRAAHRCGAVVCSRIYIHCRPSSPGVRCHLGRDTSFEIFGSRTLAPSRKRGTRQALDLRRGSSTAADRQPYSAYNGRGLRAVPKGKRASAGGARNLHPTDKLPNSAKRHGKVAYHSVAVSRGLANRLSG
jgi:hypothetical protein